MDYFIASSAFIYGVTLDDSLSLVVSIISFYSVMLWVLS